ncbi:hypothetical protein N7520_011075 [Penicillium odoratum]|uniref:uncharacterized protein n=1 Tax=Penicillium odoratum TaxID=1167516 RepID=UPI002547AF5E|nr:uncharacterized protein N7520_011075 [Penicillium odoratum]KAJ5745893.1 hypothetical protein N7520_011075 [Penicillium odoratum]
MTDDYEASARALTCASSAKVYNSLTLSCEERFASSYTAKVTTTSVFVDTDETGTATVVFTPDFDAVNAFGLEYIPMTSTSSSSSTAEATPTATATTATTKLSSSTVTTTSTTSTAANNTNKTSLSSGAIAGIVVAAVAFILIIALTWNRSKITMWTHRHSAPRPDRIEKNMYSNTFQSSPG